MIYNGIRLYAILIKHILGRENQVHKYIILFLSPSFFLVIYSAQFDCLRWTRDLAFC